MLRGFQQCDHNHKTISSLNGNDSGQWVREAGATQSPNCQPRRQHISGPAGKGHMGTLSNIPRTARPLCILTA